MIPNNITKEHIEKALKEIDEKGIKKGRHSSTYDIEYKNSLYPPKLVISLANKFANGDELDPHSFNGDIGMDASILLEKEGFQIVKKESGLLNLANTLLGEDLTRKQFNIICVAYILNQNNSISTKFAIESVKDTRVSIGWNDNSDSIEGRISQDCQYFPDKTFNTINEFAKAIRNSSIISIYKTKIKEYPNKELSINKVIHLLNTYVLDDKRSDKFQTNYWVFQGNPKVYNVIDSIGDGALKTWSVKAHKDTIKKGDKIIFWLTGSKSGCFALGETTSEVYEGVDDENELKYYKIDLDANKKSSRIDVKITDDLTSNPLTKNQINGFEDLKELKVGSQGTNFSATKEEYDTLLGMISLRKENSSDRKSIFDSIRLKMEDVGFQFEKEQKLDRQGRKEAELKFIHPKLIERLAESGYKVKAKKFYIKPLTSEPNCEIGFVTGKSSPLFNEQIFCQTNSIDTHDDASAWTNRDDDNALDNLLESIHNFLNTVDNTMNFPLNTILYGPPGTGKTYNTILRAAEIIENREIDDYNQAKEVFNENLGDRIEFITFHQNYSYEDFIQGLRPETENDSDLKFSKVDGVFKRISDRALNNIELANKAPEEISKSIAFEEALEKLKDKVNDGEKININETAYFTNAEHNAFRYTGDNWTLNDKGFTGFRMKYSDLIEFYEADIKERSEIKKLDNISGLAKQHASYFFKTYEIVKSMMSSVEIQNPSIKKQNYVIIIDEINRANISRVFGELITLIEPDKRSHGEIPLRCTLPSGDKFIVPSNLYIIGTMNTADKSIALLDIALRRRFDFEPMYPKYEIEGATIYDVEILTKINEKIKDLKGYDFQIGHAYFMGSNNNLVDRINKKVIPLLLEYFMNDEKEVKGILKNSGLEILENGWPLKISGKA